MKLLGRDIPAQALVTKIQTRLMGRSTVETSAAPLDFSGPEPRLNPAAFHLSGMQENADPAQPLPVDEAATGLRKLASLGRYGLSRIFQAPLTLTLARQRFFNQHARDAYAQLSAEILRLQEEVAALKAPPKKSKTR